MKSDRRSGQRNDQIGNVTLPLGGGGETNNAETLGSVTTVLQMIELLAGSPRPLPLSAIARTLGLSKPRTFRNLRSLMTHGYARQDSDTDRYEIGSKLMVLGESVRERFSIVGAGRQEMAVLRHETGHAVTLSALVDGRVTVLEMLQGRTMIEFGFRPSSVLALHASAHGHVTLAFGPEELLETVAGGPLPALTSNTITQPAALRAAVARVRAQGWATAVDQVLVGVNALAAPVRDHRGALAGAIAIVGAGSSIGIQPRDEQIAQVTGAAARISRQLGWE